MMIMMPWLWVPVCQVTIAPSIAQHCITAFGSSGLIANHQHQEDAPVLQSLA
jgi:hypothetical protein